MMTKKMLIDATQKEETRVAIVEGNRLQAFDFDSANRKQLKGNLYLAKVTRVEPSLQACFVEYGGNRQGFLAFSEIHPDYYRIPVEDREALLAEEAAWQDEEDQFDDLDEQDQPAKDAQLQKPGAEQPALADDANPHDLSAADQSDSMVPADDTEIATKQTASAPALLEQDSSDAVTTAPVTDESLHHHAKDDETDHSTTDQQDEDSFIQQVEKDQTIETIGGEQEDSFEEQEQTARRHSKLRRRYKIQEVIKRRQILLIQVTKEERGNKGAALTTYISLPGRYSVLMPNSPRGGGISRKIANGQDRRRMRELLDELDVPAGMSVILRTAGMQRSKQEVKRDLDYLLRLWDDIRGTTMESVAPALIYEEADIFKRAVRDLYTPDIEEISVAGPRETFLHVRDFMKLLIPSHARRVKHYTDPLVPLFQRHQVESQIDQIYSPRVELKSGGYIIINPTEALVSIDVNSGRSTRERNIDDTALNTNLEAAEEIARQLRLRDLGGLVVIDFIDMESGRHNAKVERRLKEAMSTDRARIEIGRVSPFGLLELSRQRLHPSLTETHFECCPHCEGTGLIRTTESAAVVALRMIEDEAIKGRAVQITASLPQQVAVYMLNHKRDALQRIDDYFGCRVAIHIDEEMRPNDVKIDFVKGTPQPRMKPQDLPAPVVDDLDDSDLPTEDEFALEQGEPLFPHLGDSGHEDDSSPSRNGRDRTRRRRGGRNRHDRNGERGSERQARAPHPGDGEQPVLALEDALISEPHTHDPAEEGETHGENGKERREWGRRGGRNRRRGGRDRAPQNGTSAAEAASQDGALNGIAERGDSTIIPIAANADEAAPATPPAFGRRQRQNAGMAAKSEHNAVANFPAKAPATTAAPVEKKMAPPVAPVADPVTASPQSTPIAVPQTAPQDDEGQPKKRGWWSKLVNTESEA